MPRQPLPEHLTPTTAAILATYARALPEEMDEGRRWYPRAFDLARGLDPERPHRAAGVIAALSPQMPWERNAVLARRTYELGYVPGGQTGNNVAKAERILAGEDPLDVLGGDKVRAFYRAIVGEDAVVIDRHAFDAAIGAECTDETRRVLMRVGVYERFSEAYVEAASTALIPASALQAIVWLAWRRLIGVAADGNRRGAGSRSRAIPRL